MMQIIKIWKKQQSIYLAFYRKRTVQNHRSYKLYCRQLCYHFCSVLIFFVPEKNNENISGIICYLVQYSWLSLAYIIIHQERINIRHYMSVQSVFSQTLNALIKTIKRGNKEPTVYVRFYWENMIQR